jgi:dihydroxyacid dehydratase/phosphogluconate dehydratase
MVPDYHPTVRAFLAGGVQVMLHLRQLGLLHEDAL